MLLPDASYLQHKVSYGWGAVLLRGEEHSGTQWGVCEHAMTTVQKHRKKVRYVPYPTLPAARSSSGVLGNWLVCLAVWQ